MSTREKQKKDLDLYLKYSPAVIALYKRKAVDGKAVSLTLAEVNQLWQNYAVASRVIADLSGNVIALYRELNEARAEVIIAKKIVRKIEDGVNSVRDARIAGKLIMRG